MTNQPHPTLNRDVLLARVKAAAPQVREDLRLVGARARYLWPTSEAPTTWSGYSYEIPKEEQIRSAFWASLHDREVLACELEWNIYEQDGPRVRSAGEIDLAGFAVQGATAPPVLLLEFKRTWFFKGWLNKRGEMRAGIAGDIAKLREVITAASQGPVGVSAPQLAGVVVVSFVDQLAALDEASFANLPDVTALGVTHVELWRDQSPLCEAPIDTGVPRTVHSRADFLAL